MAEKVTAWRDARGALHTDEGAALLVDIEAAMGITSNSADGPAWAKRITDHADKLLPLLGRWQQAVVMGEAA